MSAIYDIFNDIYNENDKSINTNTITGVATSGSKTTIVDINKEFITNMFIDSIINFEVDGKDYYKSVVSNTSDTITFTPALPGAKATATIGEDTNEIVVTVASEGVIGNIYEIEVKESSGTNDNLSASLIEDVLTVFLGMTGGVADDTKNTATLIATAIDQLPEFTASTSNTGVVTVTIENIPFSGGVDTIAVLTDCKYKISENIKLASGNNFVGTVSISPESDGNIMQVNGDGSINTQIIGGGVEDVYNTVNVNSDGSADVRIVSNKIIPVAFQYDASANGDGGTVDVNGMNTCIFDISGTFVATINFEVTLDGTLWRPIIAEKIGEAVISTTTTAPGAYRCNVTGFRSIRARISYYVSGGINVIGNMSVANTKSDTINTQLTGSITGKGALATVTTAGTRVQLPSFACRIVTVIAKLNNAGSIYASPDNLVSATNYGVELKAGSSYDFEVANTNQIYIDASVDGEGISYVAL